MSHVCLFTRGRVCLFTHSWWKTYYIPGYSQTSVGGIILSWTVSIEVFAPRDIRATSMSSQASSSVPHPHTNPDLCNAKAGVSKPGAPSLPAAAMEHKLPGSVTDQLACMANHLLHEPAMSPLHEPLLVVSPEIYQLACSGRPHRCVQVHV